MDRRMPKLPSPAFVACLLAMGVPWWLAPYNRLDVAGYGFAVLALVAFWLVATRGAAVFGTARTACGAAVTAAALRVVVDGLRDPTTHNLWPLELGFVAISAWGAAFVAAVVAAGARRLAGVEPR